MPALVPFEQTVTVDGIDFTLTTVVGSLPADSVLQVGAVKDEATVNAVRQAALSGALTNAAGETPGEYAIAQGTLTVGKNYTIDFTGATFRIVVKQGETIVDVETGEGVPETKVDGLMRGSC